MRLVYGIYSRKKTSRLPSIWLTLALPLCKVRVATLPRVDVERGLLLKTVHVAAGIIRKEGSDELLAVQRGYGDMLGLWEFPGGKLMRGETPEDAVRRELMEELQVKVTNLRDFYTVEYDYPDFHLSMECYYCSLADESDEPQKHDRQLDIRWIPRTSLATVEWMPADKGLIDALIELKEDRLEANGAANDAEATTTDEPASKPKRAPKRRSKKRPKPGLLDGIDTSDLSADERELVRRRAAIKKSMKGNKRANTKPELLVRQRLRAAGLTGYRLEWKVPGKPDIAFPGRKIAIFVNGCFWHRCPKCNPSQPKRNVEFWEAKFRRNVERDRAAVAALTQMGWTPITIWECELKKDRIDATMEKVIEQVRAAAPQR